jgi:hypothetical protein
MGPTQLPIQWVPVALCVGLKRPECEVAHSPPSSAEVKNGGVVPPLPYMFSLRDAQLSPGMTLSCCYLRDPFLRLIQLYDPKDRSLLQ